jgi:hypothetical protein
LYKTNTYSSSGGLVLGTSTPRGGMDITAYQNRLWMAGGIDIPGAGTTFDPNALYFTQNPLAYGGGVAAADWQDPISGLTNKIIIGGDSNDFIRALARLHTQALLILRNNSIYILRGTTTSNYTVTPVSLQQGCLDARSVVETDEGVYFIGRQGLIMCNGVKTVNMSGGLLYTLQQAIRWQQNFTLTAGTGGWISMNMTNAGELVLSIGVYGMATAGNGYGTTLLSAVYSRSAKAWTRVNSQIMGNDQYLVNGLQATGLGGTIYTDGPPALGLNYYLTQTIGDNQRRLYCLGDKYLTVVEDPASPQQTIMSDPTTGKLGQLYDYDGTNYRYIPARWRTKIVPTVGTTTLARKFGQAKRFFLDYAFAGKTPPATLSMTAAPLLVDAYDGTPVPGATNMTIAPGANRFQGSPIQNVSFLPNPLISRTNQDFFSEIYDVGFDVTISDSVNPQTGGVKVMTTDLYGIGVEYQPTRDLR